MRLMLINTIVNACTANITVTTEPPLVSVNVFSEIETISTKLYLKRNRIERKENVFCRIRLILTL